MDTNILEINNLLVKNKISKNYGKNRSITQKLLVYIELHSMYKKLCKES